MSHVVNVLFCTCVPHCVVVYWWMVHSTWMLVSRVFSRPHGRQLLWEIRVYTSQWGYLWITIGRLLVAWNGVDVFVPAPLLFSLHWLVKGLI